MLWQIKALKMKVVALGKLISEQGSTGISDRDVTRRVCVHPTNPSTLNIISLSLVFISAEPTPII